MIVMMSIKEKLNKYNKHILFLKIILEVKILNK